MIRRRIIKRRCRLIILFLQDRKNKPLQDLTFLPAQEHLLGSIKSSSQIAARRGKSGASATKDSRTAEAGGDSWGIKIEPGNLRRKPGDHKEGEGDCTRQDGGREFSSFDEYKGKGKVAAGEGGREVRCRVALC